MARERRARDPEKVRAKDRQRHRKMTPEQKARVKQRAKDKYEQGRLEKALKRRCVVCGGAVPVEFILARQTCSDECNRIRAHEYSLRYRRKNGVLDERSEEARRAKSERRREWWAQGGKFKPRPCRCCGEMFAPASPPQRYCSLECKQFGQRGRFYGVDPAELRRVFDTQGAVCAICGTERKGWVKSSRRKGALVVDHCHTSGKIRGFLCGDCNTALGRFDDDPKLLRRAADYLER